MANLKYCSRVGLGEWGEQLTYLKYCSRVEWGEQLIITYLKYYSRVGLG